MENPIEQYIAQLPDEKRAAITKLREIIIQNIPIGFKEELSYGMIGYVVPHDIFPKGYHCNPTLPLPFLNIAAQKSHIAIYHIGIYANKNLYDWFVSEYPNHTSAKLDMGKSCIRFKKPEHIPYDLIGELVSKMTVADWIGCYENMLKKS